ncbi:MAG: hypothetical protein PHR74_05970 [Candidatus Omnitrophica bacterium]|jgi:hypothetical protein|nr:hypothetical protein [Candidatus Omnitrophota bacterium]
MSRIRAEGYSEEVVSRWKNEYNIKNAYSRFRTENEIDRLKTRARVRIIYVGLTLPFIITIFILSPGRVIATLLFSAVIVLIISLMRYWARN